MIADDVAYMREVIATMEAQVLDRRPIEHPQYIEGKLYVTQPQLAALHRIGNERPIIDWSYATPMHPGIEAVVVKSGESIMLPSGRRVVNSKFLPDRFIIMPPVGSELAELAEILGVLRIDQ